MSTRVSLSEISAPLWAIAFCCVAATAAYVYSII